MEANNEVLKTDEGTYLTEDNVLLLKQMFKDETTYCEYMKTLWALRYTVTEKLDMHIPHCTVYNKKSSLFKIFVLTNELIGALSQNDWIFSMCNDEVKYWKR
jgi:hypothetical protein